MSRGYSVRVVDAIKNGDRNLLGVRLGQACVDQDISVADAARTLGVTRTTAYHWFLGLVEPRGRYVAAITAFLGTLD